MFHEGGDNVKSCMELETPARHVVENRYLLRSAIHAEQNKRSLTETIMRPVQVLLILQVCVADLSCVFSDRRKHGFQVSLMTSRETSNARWEHESFFVALLSLRRFLYRG